MNEAEKEFREKLREIKFRYDLKGIIDSIEREFNIYLQESEKCLKT